MTSPQPSHPGRRWAVVSALATIVSGLAVNLFTDSLPDDWRWAHDWRLSGVVVAVLGGLTVWIALRPSGPSATGPAFGYARRYRRWTADTANALDTSGLITIGPRSPGLEAVFVDVALAEQAPVRVDSGLLHRADVAEVRRQSVWDFLRRPHGVVLVLLGAAGSGKTTLLRHVARETAGGRWRVGSRRLPVLLQIRDRVAAITADPAPGLPDLIRGSLPDAIGPGRDRWWERRLRAGRCVVLLDGLDEVAGEDDRRAVVRWINRQLPGWPGNDFVITSRPHGYRDSYIDNATTVQTLPFSPEQVRRFLRHWYRAEEGDAARGREQADHLVEQLHARPGLHDLTVNPLLLTMIANVHRHGDRPGLPDNRAALYGEMCAVMLWRRDKEKGRRLEMPGPRRLALLAWLACRWMERGVRGHERRAVIETLRPRLADQPVPADRFVDAVLATGLLQETAPRTISFAHQTFQEYLAARHLGETGGTDVLVRAVDDPWWRETTLLYAAEHDADPIVAAALRSGTAAALALAFAIIESDGRVSSGPRAELEEVLVRGLAPDADAPLRRVAVDVLVGRLLHAVTGTPTGARLCPPVPVDLYRAFLADTGTPPPDVPAPDEPTAAARGIWRPDVTAFVGWINMVVASGPRRDLALRLPTMAELDVAPTALPAWASGPARYAGPAVTSVTADDLEWAVFADLRGTRFLSGALAEIGLDLVRRTRLAAEEVQRAADDPAVGPGGLSTAVDALVRAPRFLPAILAAGPDRALAGALTTEMLEPAFAAARTTDAPVVQEAAVTIDRVLAEALARPGPAPGRTRADDVLASAVRVDPPRPDDLLEPVRAIGDTVVADAGVEKVIEVDLPGLAARVARIRRHPWPDPVLGRIAEVADPVVNRREPVTAEVASAVRLPALLMARAARESGARDLADDLVALAAGMCLLERRRRIPDLGERLILAYD